MNNQLNLIYRKLYRAFGPQHWWPADTSFEVMVGAILAQNTSWKNVEKAIGNLKKHNLLTPDKLYKLDNKRLAVRIKAAGYYNLKARRLKEFLKFFFARYKGDIKKMLSVKFPELRRELLCVNGIGPETADSILLYALNKPVFVIDAYTKRIFSRHRLIRKNAVYGEIQNFFRQNLENKVKLFNEYHALLVRLGKEYCLKRRPKCEECPLKVLSS